MASSPLAAISAIDFISPKLIEGVYKLGTAKSKFCTELATSLTEAIALSIEEELWMKLKI